MMMMMMRVLWQVYEGYGQTECTAGLTFTLSNEFRTGNSRLRRRRCRHRFITLR